MNREPNVVSIARLKARLSHYLRRVRRGETLTITNRGRAVASLGPTVAGRIDDRMQRLIDQGLARGPSSPPLPADFWNQPRPEDPAGQALRGLLDEREEGL